MEHITVPTIIHTAIMLTLFTIALVARPIIGLIKGLL